MATLLAPDRYTRYAAVTRSYDSDEFGLITVTNAADIAALRNAGCVDIPSNTTAVYGGSVVALGDSITAANDDAAFGLRADSYITHAMLALNGRINLRRNSGVGGNTSAQMLARLQTDVLAYAPNICAIVAGTNDTDPVNETLPNLTAIITRLLNAGIRPVLATIPPSGCAAISAPSLTATPSTSGGTLATGSYSYKITAVNSAGETLASTAATASVTGPTGSVTLTWAPVQGAAAYRIYGRTSGSELRITSTGGLSNHPTYSYTDTGSVTPSGALPGSNTTAISVSTTVRTKIAKVNAIVTRLAQTYGLPLVDFYGLLTDPATGSYKDGYTVDGTHPTAKTQRLMGQLWATTMSPYLAPFTPFLAGDNADPSVIYTNPLFTNNSGGNPTGFGPYNGSSAESITTDAAVKGNVYKVTRTDATGRYNGLTLSGSPGDRICVAGMVKVTNADAAGGQAQWGLTSDAGAFAEIQLNTDTPNSDWCAFYIEGVVPSGATSVSYIQNLGYGPITFQIGQLTFRNLTSLGLT